MIIAINAISSFPTPPVLDNSLLLFSLSLISSSVKTIPAANSSILPLASSTLPKLSTYFLSLLFKASYLLVISSTTSLSSKVIFFLSIFSQISSLMIFTTSLISNILFLSNISSVSYTHLDVYKRQSSL